MPCSRGVPAPRGSAPGGACSGGVPALVRVPALGRVPAPVRVPALGGGGLLQGVPTPRGAWRPPRKQMATVADGTHPIGMHSCF